MTVLVLKFASFNLHVEIKLFSSIFKVSLLHLGEDFLTKIKGVFVRVSLSLTPLDDCTGYLLNLAHTVMVH